MWHKMELKAWSCMCTCWAHWGNNRSFGSVQRWARRNLWNQGWCRQSVSLHHDLFFFSFFHFWSPVISKVNDAQIYLQQEGLASDQCVQKLKALPLFCQKKLDCLVLKATEKALQMCKTYDISTERRFGRCKKMPGEQSCDAGLTLVQDTFREQTGSNWSA